MFAARAGILVCALALVLSACGGGGGGGGSSDNSSNSASTSSASSSAASSSSSFWLPSLQSPQAGSTAANGNGTEGIWISGLTVGLIAPDGLFFIQQMGFLGGNMTASNGTWQFSNNAEYVISTAATTTVTGSGSYIANRTLNGTYRLASSTTDSVLSLNGYANGNALAVTQASTAGTWTTSNAISLTIDNNGTLTGSTTGATYGTCSLTGGLKLYTQNSSKNLYATSLTATNSATGTDTACKLPAGQTFTGLAGITYDTSNGKQQLVMMVRIPGQIYFSAYPVKQ